MKARRSPSADNSERRFSDVTVQVWGMAALLLGLVVISWLTDPRFLSAYNLQTMSREIAILALFAIGQGIVIIAGGIDLSVGSIVCFVGLNTITFLAPEYGYGWPVFAVLAAALFFSTSLGALHGVLVCHLRLQPFMVTLCSLLIYRSLARGVSDDQTRAYRAVDLELFSSLGRDMVLHVPVPVWILLGTGIVLAMFMNFVVYGRYLFAIGYNLEAARFSGVRTHTLRVATFALSGFLAGLAGILEASQIGSVAPSTSGLAYELHGITAAVLGGCALRGGQGSIIGIIIGAAILKVMQRMIVFLGLGTHWTDAVIGSVLLVAVVTDSLVKRRRGT